MSGAVRRWLQEQGFERFADLFEASEIDDVSLRELGDGHLKELGIPLGPRIRLLRAIEALRDAEEVAASSAVAAPSPAGQAERRQLTVMFVDLVGSTALSARLDPEEMGAVLRAYQNAVAGEIARFEGHVGKFMGDGVLAYFGWPRAHEDEAERAVRAGLAVRDAVGRLTGDGSPLACRVGIATGLVVVGELIGEGTASEQTVVGDTPNLAGRLQALAESGQVVVAEATARLLDAGFQLDDLGEHSLKGLALPVRAWAVGGERIVPSRFDARGRPQPLVGRDQELALLLERWAQASAGEGQAVLLVGEAGVGKSRIGRALLDAVASKPHTRIRYQCSPYHQDSALWPVVQQLRHAAGLVATDAAAVRLGKLEKLLGQAGEVADAVAPIADLLGIEGAARHGTLAPTPQARRERLLAALVDQLRGLARTRPVLMLLEDAHWIDPTTLELIELALDAVAEARVLIVITSRPDQQPALASHPHVTRLSLNRLSRAGAEAIVLRLGGDKLPAATIDAIIGRADGVPLYVEELTKAILESGDTAIPASLHGSLMARLDRVPEAKEIAQIAACIGRVFGHELLVAVAGWPEAELRDALGKLTAAELVFRHGTAPDARYTFKHALVQDAAYESLLRSRRQAIHGQIARILAEHFPEQTAAQPELLALHLTEARLPAEAMGYWAKAGQSAAARSAHLEAIQHLSRALDLLALLPLSTDHDRQELDLLMALGSAYSATKGFAAQEVEQTYERVRDISRAAGNAHQARPALQGLRVLYMVRGDLAAATRLGEELLRDSGDSPSHQFEAQVALGVVDVVSGRLRAARTRLVDARALAIHARQSPLVHQPVGDLEIVCLAHLSSLLYLKGYPEQSHELRVEALRLARASSHPFDLAQALGITSLCNLARTEPTDLETARELLEIAEEHSFDFWQVWGRAWIGWAHANNGEPERGVVELRRSVAEAEVMGVQVIVVAILVPLLATLGCLGKLDEALALVERQRAMAARTGIRLWDPLVLLLEAGVRRRLPERRMQVVEDCLGAAVSTAQAQGSRMVELRAARDLARLWAERGERQRARDLLAPICGWFTEGFDTPDLVEAKALLDAL